MTRLRPIRILVLLLAVGTVLLAGCGSDSKSDAGTIKAGQLSVCSDIPYEPFEFEGAGPDGLKYTGFDIDLIAAIAKTADLKVAVKVVGFDGILGNIAAGDCDVAVSSITITDERAKQVDFSDPYFDADQSLLVKKDGDVSDLASLAAKTIGVQSGTTGEAYAKDHKPDGATIKSYEGAPELFSAIEADEIQAVLQDFPVNAYRATKDDSVEVSATFKTDEQYGFAVKKDNSDLLKAIDDGLAKTKDDGDYATLYKKYFGTEPPA